MRHGEIAPPEEGGELFICIYACLFNRIFRLVFWIPLFVRRVFRALRFEDCVGGMRSLVRISFKEKIIILYLRNLHKAAALLILRARSSYLLRDYRYVGNAEIVDPHRSCPMV